MKRFLLSALLAAALVVLAAAQDARSHYPGPYRVVYAPVYHCPPPSYYYASPVYRGPTYYPAPRYVRPAGKVVEVGAYDKVGFKPKTINVEPGTTVRWVNHGKEVHTVTSRDGKFDSGDMSPGASYSVTFVTPGTYHYFCKPHEKMGMVGTVVVGPRDKAGKSDKNTHDGTFVKAKSESEFVMEEKGKQHSHTLAEDARVIGPDGKEAKLADLKKGQKIRVTTREGDKKIATRVEALKAKEE